MDLLNVIKAGILMNTTAILCKLHNRNKDLPKMVDNICLTKKRKYKGPWPPITLSYKVTAGLPCLPEAFFCYSSIKFSMIPPKGKKVEIRKKTNHLITIRG